MVRRNPGVTWYRPGKRTGEGAVPGFAVGGSRCAPGTENVRATS